MLELIQTLQIAMVIHVSMTLLAIARGDCSKEMLNDHGVNVNATNKNITTALKQLVRREM